MIIHDHWSCWSCMKFVDHAMIRYWSCMISVDHAMKGCWSCMKSVDHAMKGCWSYMMINDHCHERLLIIHDQHWSVYHIVTTTNNVLLPPFLSVWEHTVLPMTTKPVYTTSRVGSLPWFKPHRWDASHSCCGGYFSSHSISLPLDPTLHPVLPGS